MLMMAGPSGWVAGATRSHSQVGVEVFGGPKVDLPAVEAAEKAQVADGIASSSSTVHCHIKCDKISGQHP